MMLSIAFVMAVIVLWLIGGQFWKPARRYLIPTIASLYALFLKDRHKRRFAPLLLILSAILSMGYGEDSHLRKLLCGSEFWTRVVMALLIASVPITYSSLTNGCSLNCVLMLVMNIGAWQVRAGSLCKIGRYDVLIEDICRSLALGVSIAIM